MKIALTIDDPSKDSVIAKLFGRSQFFWFYETETLIEEIKPNPFAATFGGAGIQTAKMMIENNVDVIIASKIGSNAAKILEAADIKSYYAEANEARANFVLLQYLAGKLAVNKTMQSEET